MIVILDSYTANPGDISWDSAVKDLPLAEGELKIYPRTAPEDVVARCQGADIVLTNKVIISREVIKALPALRYVGVLATGYNVVDLAAAREHGIIVTNIPAYSTMSVAQMVFAHILNIANGVGAHANAVREGAWQNSADFMFTVTPQQELASLTLGIVGLGNTGLATARIALAFGMRLAIFTSKSAGEVESLLGSKDFIVTKNVDDVFRVADYLSLHCPLTDTTRHLVNAERLKLMKSSAVIINTGRGPLVDEAALAEALANGTIRAAAADVLTQEPPRDGSPLIPLSNCHLTPHIAWASKAARERLLTVAFDNIRAYLAGNPQNVVS